MSKFIINGGKKLSGEIRVSGSKNALFPLLSAALLTDEKCVFENVPEISDKKAMVEILRDLGAEVSESDHRLEITAKEIKNTTTNPQLVGKLRGSILVIGGLLGRMGEVETTEPGGDKIGSRSIDTHISSLQQLGVEFSNEHDLLTFKAVKLIGTKIIMDESSVLATENVILAAATAHGKTIIKLAAMEPHVQQLCEFINLMGGKISGIGTPTIIIEGVTKLHGAEIALIPDSNEAASFITLGAATKSDLLINGVNPDYMDDFLLKLKKMNVNFEIGPDFVRVNKPNGDYLATKIQGGLYPKLASDDIPPMAVLATQAVGKSVMNEWMYENRLGYATELMKMGAVVEAVDSHNVIFTGPTPLKGDKMTSVDIRMGMTLVIAGLVAEGTSEIEAIEHIDRGYENIEQRLTAVGADIKRIE
ncbi:MAG: UDP-N-acetylglucosamine 1-carboxyvinyltransferase [Candidatus Doudnabacteria bacterium]|nr:UDP-N-acetylglucosamine 1-carboxyvinyltransferase [Candidatus Doudnabacteria bacterium]